MAGTDLVPVGEYAAMKTADMDGFVAAVQENLGGRQLGPQDLDRVGMPTGGGTAFSVPSIRGEQLEQKLTGVIVGFRNVRRYWKESLDESGGGNPPDCRSEDSIWGYGDPGDELRARGVTCSECPNAQWGSGDRNSQACQQRRLMFLLREKGLLPLVVDLSPASFGPAQKYVQGVLAEGLRPHNAVTTISLKRASGEGVPDYAVAEFRLEEVLEGTEAEKMAEYAEQLKPVFSKVAQAEAERPAGETPAGPVPDVDDPIE